MNVLRKGKRTWLLFVVSLLIMPLSQARDIYVSEQGTGDGSSWAKALSEKDLEKVVNQRYPEGGINIHVSEGTYTLSGVSASFQLQKGVKILGGYSAAGDGTRDWKKHITILNGDIAHNDGVNFTNRLDNADHVVTGSGDLNGALLDGFYIQGGGKGIVYGGGIYLVGVSDAGTGPLLRNLLIRDCFSDNGAAIANASSRHIANRVKIEHIEITGNRATHVGGGIFNTTADMDLTQVVIRNNTAVMEYGGGIVNSTSTVVMKDVIVSENTAGNYGGGIVNTTATAILTNVVANNNTARMYGGGIVNTTVDATFSQVTANNNRANSGDGGGIYNTTCVFHANKLEVRNNYAAIGGGGITNTTVGGDLRGFTEAYITDARIEGNTAGRYGGGMFNTTAKIGLRHVKVVGNKAEGHDGAFNAGGGIHNTTVHIQLLWNVLIANNVASNGYGGGILNTTCHTDCQYINTTIANNYASMRGGGVYNTTARQSYKNTIVSGNRTAGKEVEDFYTEGLGYLHTEKWYKSSFEYSTIGSIFGGIKYGEASQFSYPSLVNSFLEPAQFVAPVPASLNPSTAGDYHLRVGSRAIDAGNDDFIRPLADYPWMDTDLDGQARIQGKCVDMGAYEGPGEPNLWVGGASTDPTSWQVAGNWLKGKVLDENEALVFSPEAKADLVLTGADRHQVASIENKSSRRLVVGDGSYLRVWGDVVFPENEPEKYLLIKSNNTASSVNGTFIYPQGTQVQATVEFYSKALSEAHVTKVNDLAFQYIGIPVERFPASAITQGRTSSTPGWYLRKYVESVMSKRWWIWMSAGDELLPFEGYEITRKDAEGFNRTGVVSYTGRLVNENRLLTLSNSRNEDVRHDLAGWHVISNPYTAGLPIDKGLALGDEMERTVYLFHTGTQNAYSEQEGEGIGASQMLAVPVKLAGKGIFPSTIASMQGFMVKLKEEETTRTGHVEFRYDAVSDNVRTRSVLAEPEELPYSAISLKCGTKVKDITWLFLEASTSFRFCDGYDGYKLITDPNASQLYGCKDKEAFQVSTIPAIRDFKLGFKAEEGVSSYTLSFEHNQAMSDQCPEIYLYDVETGQCIDVSCNGASYSFTVENTSLPASERFVLSTQKEGAFSAKAGRLVWEQVKLRTADRRLEVVNPQEDSVSVFISDSTGKRVTTQEIPAGSLAVIRHTFEPGIYLIRLSNSTGETTQKIIVR